MVEGKQQGEERILNLRAESEAEMKTWLRELRAAAGGGDERESN